MDIPKNVQRACKKFKLTTRETETLVLLSQGNGWKNIAATLSVSISTVRFHSHNICRKTGCVNAFSSAIKVFVNLK